MVALIDTDPGIDDALALLFAWGSPELEVAAVTTVAGNVPVAVATQNLLRLLDLKRPAPRPRIAVGAARPLARELRTATGYHGEDGLGDVAGWPAVDPSSVPSNAVEVLVDTARHHRTSLTLVALGPLTNLALALDADRAAMATIGRAVVMGGAVDVPGNVTPTAEFNAWVDPEAVRAVLAAGLPIDLVPLGATRQAVLPRADLDARLARVGGPLAARVAAFTELGFRVDAGRGTPGMVLHDPLAVGVAIDPTLVSWEPARLSVERDGETRRTAGVPNCRVARRVDANRFLAMFLDRLLPAS
jgi:inosine-uridine nucleoside N-ribohydrolase